MLLTYIKAASPPLAEFTAIVEVTMTTAKELIDLAEKCFQQADQQCDHAAAEALREQALRCLEDACFAPTAIVIEALPTA
ncbi:MAG TPA: hypothetical protein VFB45_21045 [Pseudolabrys sp.]|nr:hypothetical protein [Pseudolabrys sp.]